MIGCDINGLGYKKQGRGNACPVTIILPKLALLSSDEEDFFKRLDEALDIAEEGLLARFERICKQSPKSATFMYENGTVVDYEKNKTDVWESQKHNTLGVGIIGMHETCMALYQKSFYEDEETLQNVVKILDYIKNKVNSMKERNHLNFAIYFAPAESLCHTSMKKLKNEFGIIEGITDREYLTNSCHVPVFAEVSMLEKIKIESNFTSYGTAGCITYVELDGSVYKNKKAIEQIINYAMDKDIPYLALNIPLDMCEDCGYQAEINEDICPQCNSNNIQRLRRVTGYLTTDYRKFNKGKQEEVKMRIKHKLEE